MPPKVTAGLARSRVSGYKRSPAPPAKRTPRVSFITDPQIPPALVLAPPEPCLSARQLRKEKTVDGSTTEEGCWSMAARLASYNAGSSSAVRDGGVFGET